ncbi:MAG: DHH family phosphoesterase [Moorellales bacterium]
MSKAVLITHNDFDGTVCAILFKAVYPDGVFYLENYDTVDERIKQVLEEKPTLLYITDISPQSEEVIEQLDEYWYDKVFLVDHHKTALHLNSFDWAYVRTDSCAARLFKRTLELGRGPSTPYGKLVFHANDYDLWLHQDPHSAVLNSLLYAIGHERFINRFLQNPSVELTETEKYLLEIEQEKEAKYIQEAVEAAKVYGSFAVTFAERLASQIGQKMLETYPVDVAVIVNAQKGVVSLRSKEADISAFAKALGGGGHPKAAGFTLPKHLFHDEIADLLMEVWAL